ncbi:unnamed protein product [Heterobilharzia americana]|nr:unnamed protein product [Heterobilharzia americana]
MRIATAQRIYKNSNQCLYYDYFKYTSAKSDFLRKKQDHCGLFYTESQKKEGLRTLKYVELFNGGLNTSVTVFISPHRFDSRQFSQAPEAKECFVYKRHVFLLGLAAGLVSLGSLWLYNIFEWCSSSYAFESAKVVSQVFSSEDAVNKKYPLNECKHSADSNQKTVTYFDRKSNTINLERGRIDAFHALYNASSYDRYSPNFDETPSEKYCSSNNDFVSNTVSKCQEIQLLHGSNFLWTSACINCPHFNSGSNKICTICWLNMPDYWLYGPTWSSPNGSFHLSHLWGNTSILGFLICLQLIYKAICVACCNNATKRSCSTQTSPPSTPDPGNYRYADFSRWVANTPFKFDDPSITTTTTPSIVAFGTTQTTVSDNSLSQTVDEKLNSLERDQSNDLYPLEVLNSFVIKSNETDINYSNHHEHLKRLSSSIDNVLFPSMKAKNIQPTSMNTKSLERNTVPSTTVNLSIEQLSSKVVDFLSARQVDWLNGSPRNKSSSSSSSCSLMHCIRSDTVPEKTIRRNEYVKSLSNGNDYTNQSTRNSVLYHRSRFHSNSGSSTTSLSCFSVDDNEGFEYDDIIAIQMTKDNGIMKKSENLVNVQEYIQDNYNDDGDVDEEYSEERAENILRQLDTLSSLLNSRSDSYLQEKSNEVPLLSSESTDTIDTTDDVLGTPSSMDNKFNKLLSKSDTDRLEFTDLTQKTVLLTNELNKLGATLDRLLYKLQANQIQLDQAEDNLDYMWYLKDNLDEDSSSDTSDCCSAVPLSDIEAEGILHDDNTDMDDNVDINDYWSSRGRMNVSPTHLNHHSNDPDVPGYLSHSNGTLDYPFDPTFRIPRIHCDNSSNMDSGLEQSVITCSESSTHMISSMPEDQLKNIFGHYSSYKYLSNSQNFKDFSRPFSKYSRLKKRYNHSRMREMFSNEGSRYSIEVHPDPDGFVHPDFTFEDDGVLDWSEPIKVNPVQKKVN